MTEDDGPVIYSVTINTDNRYQYRIDVVDKHDAAKWITKMMLTISDNQQFNGATVIEWRKFRKDKY